MLFLLFWNIAGTYTNTQNIPECQEHDGNYIVDSLKEFSKLLGYKNKDGGKFNTKVIIIHEQKLFNLFTEITQNCIQWYCILFCAILFSFFTTEHVGVNSWTSTILCCVLAFQKSRILAQMLNYTPIKNSGFECTLRVNILAANSKLIGSRHPDTLSIMIMINTIPSLHFCRDRGPMIH